MLTAMTDTESLLLFEGFDEELLEESRCFDACPFSVLSGFSLSSDCSGDVFLELPK
jgi:hypothetical protein